MTLRTTLVAVLLLSSRSAFGETEIGFIETFSLADDRAKALEELIPGTDEYYYYHCLHSQNTGNREEYDRHLQHYIQRHGYTQRVNELRYRQTLLDYETNPKGSLEFIRSELGLQFNHRPKTDDNTSSAPTQLDPDKISTTTLLTRALGDYDNLHDIEPEGLELLAHRSLNSPQRRDLLSRLQRPDYPGLVDLVVADLQAKHSRGFGSHTIHRNMLLEQLDELSNSLPGLNNQDAFVRAYLTKLRPNNDVDIDRNATERAAYLERLWQFVADLDPVHNSLKANVLYHRLDHDRHLGAYNTRWFATYIQFPRNVHYVNQKWLNSYHGPKVDLNQRFNEITLPPINDEEPLVQDFLRHLLRDASDFNTYSPFIHEIYLKKTFATTKIEQGIGEVEAWASLLSPTDYKALKERVDLDFAYDNPRYVGPDELVKLDLFTKNVNDLIIKVFEIQPVNYYRDNQTEVNLAVNLDGLVAYHEERRHYEEAPTRRIRRSFEFPQIEGRGVYVVEFIGNGKSSRALVQKGRLHLLEQITPAGHGMTVLDESNHRVEDAAIWLAGREFTPEEDGVILLPFSRHPKREQLVVQQGRFASLVPFQHKAEEVTLRGSFYVHREALLKREKAQVLVRPVLQLNGMPISLDLLEDVRLVIKSMDLHGISTRQEIQNFKLHDEQESVHEFQVPEGLSNLRFELHASLQNISRNTRETLTTSRSFELNQIDRTPAVECLHVRWANGSYLMELRGKNGEAKAAYPLAAQFKHRMFRRMVPVSLQTDDNGQCMLGPLHDISFFTVNGPDGKQLTWRPLRNQCFYPPAVHATTSDTIRLPFPIQTGDPTAQVSLLDKVADQFTRNLQDKLTIGSGNLEIQPLPPGDYDLMIKPFRRSIRLRITEGDKALGYALSDSRALQILNPAPLRIGQVDVQANMIEVKLANASTSTRVHVIANRYLPEYDLFERMHFHGGPGPSYISRNDPETLYVSGRNIGDEYRYILERRFATHYPGNMLQRPGLLLNPWSIRKTDTGAEELAKGEDYADKISRSLEQGFSDEPAEGQSMHREHYANLDFLGHPAVVAANLKPDKNGFVHIDRSALGDHVHVQILAVDRQNAVTEHLSLPDTNVHLRELRLTLGLDPKKHFAEQKLVSVVATNETFTIADVTTSDMEIYDSLPKVFALFSTLSGNTTLHEFSFLLDWPDLNQQKKRDKYSDYACHELNLFLYFKDPAFFSEVVAPYLHNKKDQTFVDHWLLEKDLTGYLEPWTFSRLNVVERILLGLRIPEQHATLARHANDLNDLVPPDLNRFNRLFDTAVQSSTLDTGADFNAFADAARDQLASVGSSLQIDPADTPMAPSPIQRGLFRQDGRVASEKTAMQMAKKSKAAKTLSSSLKEELVEADMETFEQEEAMDESFGFATRKEARKRQRRFFQKLDKTEEFVENNYYRLPIAQHTSDLITVNNFWTDFAKQEGITGFLSPHLAEATRNFSEMMLALSVLDLPFIAKDHDVKAEAHSYQVTPGNPLLVFHKEIREGERTNSASPILISQQVFRANDRYRYENNERYQQNVINEYLPHVAYGCQVVLTNPTENRQKLSLLLQIPKGAVPVNTGFYTKGIHVTLEPYATVDREYFFYFPETGLYEHYPVHVAKDGDHLTNAKPTVFNVVSTLSDIDTTSWAYLSQHGTDEQVLTYLQEQNIARINLADIAWRMKDKAPFQQVIHVIHSRHFYDDVLWSYGIYHNVLPVARQFLKHSTYADRVGNFIDTPLLTVDPVASFAYQHLEYAPLINPRAHRVGQERTILNHRFRKQVQHLMKVLSYHRTLNDNDRLAVATYLFLQDRVEEGIAQFASVSPDHVTSQLQYNYLKAYVSLYQEDLDTARSLAHRYADYPVPKWQQRFRNLGNQLEELDGVAQVADEENRQQAQDQLSATEPSLELKIDAQQIELSYRNLVRCDVNYYPMDIELLFSRNPFLQKQSARFSFIRPVQSETIALPANQDRHLHDIPESFRNRNVMVEVVAGGLRRSQAYYANALTVQVIENYGQVRVLDNKLRKPLSKVYVKVYARMQDGHIKFLKDGYTDFRGRFDYVSLNTNELDNVDHMSILILSKERGAVIREAAPPKR